MVASSTDVFRYYNTIFANCRRLSGYCYRLGSRRVTSLAELQTRTTVTITHFPSSSLGTIEEANGLSWKLSFVKKYYAKLGGVFVQGGPLFLFLFDDPLASIVY